MKLLIKNGTLYDGSGKSGCKASVLVDGEVIEGVYPQGEELPVDIDRVIDAEGLLVTPGFIDSHAHSDAYLIVESSAPSKITQGITTEINGQCGGSAVPRYGEARLSSDWAAILGDRLSWRSFSEYREAFEKAAPTINSIQFIGHNTLRSSVVGYVGRSADADELKRMVYLLEESLDSGGWGLSTGLIYQPGKYATLSEVETLASAVAKRGGLYATHMRSEGDRILESISEVAALAEKTGIRAEISHLKTSGKKNWHKLDAVFEKIEDGISRGLLLGSDRYPFSAAGTDLDVVLPDWAQEGAALSEMERFKDVKLRARIIGELNDSPRDWHDVMIGGTWSKENKRYSGRRVSEILEGTSPGEKIVEILERDGCKTSAFFFGMSEENMMRILSKDWIVPGSDASLRAPWGPLGVDHPHPRAYATMPEFFRIVSSLSAASTSVDDSIAHTIARMTRVPAQRFGIMRRGEIKKNYYADIAVWDKDSFVSKSTYDDPHQFAMGMKYVIVNGSVAFDNGVITSQGKGKLLTP